MREIFNQNNISMMLEKGINPDEYIKNIVDQNLNANVKTKFNNITNVIDKQSIDIVEFLIRIKAKIKYISSGTTGHFFKGAVYYYYENERIEELLMYMYNSYTELIQLEKESAELFEKLNITLNEEQKKLFLKYVDKQNNIATSEIYYIAKKIYNDLTKE